MSALASKNSTETVSDALWMSLFAGLGGVFIALLLLGGFYLFDPIGKLISRGTVPMFSPVSQPSLWLLAMCDERIGPMN